MGQLLKQSTAVNITILMIDSADHVTGKTGLAAGLTIYATKAAGTPATITPTVTELDATNVKGLYKLALTTGHTDTLGELQLHITASGADPTDVAHQVVAIDVADSVRAGLTALPNVAAGATNGLPLAVDSSGRVDVLKVNGTSQTARDLGASVLVAGDLSATMKTSVENAVWNATMSSHVTSGSTGASLNAAGSAGDPWATTLPGAYGAGTAGKLIGDNVNATIASRLASASYTAPSNSDITAIKAKTDNLPASPAATTDIPTANANADALLDRAAGVETSRTLRQAMRLMLAALTGKLSGAATTTVVIRDTNDTKDRITATVDTNGNRTAVTYDAS